MLTKINIAEQLHKIAEANAALSIAESEDVLLSVTGHLANTDEETLKMLDLFATGKQVKEVKSKVESSKKVLAGKFVTRQDIKNVCVKYNLRFLPVRMYAKSVPFSALDDLRKFKETFKQGEYKPTESEAWEQRMWSPSLWNTSRHIPLMQTEEGLKYFHQDRLFIIAPANHFTTIHEPVTQDPVICYDKGNGQYQVVTKFGNDFTILRRVSGLINDNTNVFKSLAWITCIIVGALLIAFGGTTTKELTDQGFGGLICIAVGLFFGIGMWVNLSYEDSKSTSNIWDTTTGIK